MPKKFKKLPLAIKLIVIVVILVLLGIVLAFCFPKKNNKTNANFITAKNLTEEQKKSVNNFVSEVKNYYQQKYAK